MKRGKPQVIRQVDVARRAGLSQRTVSAVLGRSGTVQLHVSPRTARRIRDLAAKMGYRPFRPAQQMKGIKSGIIGVLIGAAEVEINYRRLSAIERLARENGYRLMVGYLHDEHHVNEYVDDFQARDVEGILCMRHDLTLAPPTVIPQRLRNIQHVVYMDPPSGIMDACYVQPDRANGIAQAFAHLRARGRRRIGLVLDDQGISFPMRERHRGYLESLAAAGEPVQEELTWTSPDSLHIASPHISCIVDDLVIHRRADAVLASNDAIAVAMIKELRRRGLAVPHDVAIVGYDNVSIGSFVEPELTTIDHENERLVSLLLVMLMMQMKGEVLPASERQVIVQPRLIVRGST